MTGPPTFNYVHSTPSPTTKIRMMMPTEAETPRSSRPTWRCKRGHGGTATGRDAGTSGIRPSPVDSIYARRTVATLFGADGARPTANKMRAQTCRTPGRGHAARRTSGRSADVRWPFRDDRGLPRGGARPHHRKPDAGKAADLIGWPDRRHREMARREPCRRRSTGCTPLSRHGDAIMVNGEIVEAPRNTLQRPVTSALSRLAEAAGTSVPRSIQDIAHRRRPAGREDGSPRSTFPMSSHT